MGCKSGVDALQVTGGGASEAVNSKAGALELGLFWWRSARSVHIPLFLY